MKYLDLEGHLQKVLQSMLLFLSRTKLPGRQPSEVKFRSRPRLLWSGGIRGRQTVPRTQGKPCPQTASWHEQNLRSYRQLVLFKGDKPWHFSREWETTNMQKQSERLLQPRHPTKFRGKSGFQMNRSILKATISDILRLTELAWLQILAQHSSVYILGNHSQKIKSKENMLLFRPSVAHVFQTQCRFFHNLTRYLRVGAKKEKISSKHFQKKLLMDVITPHKSYLLKSSHIYLPGTILNSRHIYFI